MLTKRVIDCLDCQIIVCIFEEQGTLPSQTSSPQSLAHQMKSTYWLNGIVSYLKYFWNAAEKKPRLGSRALAYQMACLLFLSLWQNSTKKQPSGGSIYLGSRLQRRQYTALAFADSWFIVRPSVTRAGMCGGCCVSHCKEYMAQSDPLNCDAAPPRPHPSNFLPPARPHPSKIISPAGYQPVNYEPLWGNTSYTNHNSRTATTFPNDIKRHFPPSWCLLSFKSINHLLVSWELAGSI